MQPDPEGEPSAEPMGSAPQYAALATELQAADLEDVELQMELGEELLQHLKWLGWSDPHVFVHVRVSRSFAAL